MTEPVSTADLVLYIKERFHNTSDLFIETTEWQGEPAIICYYSVMTEGSQVSEQFELIRQRAESGLSDWGETAVSTVLPFAMSTVVDAVCTGSVAVILPKSNLLLKITVPKISVRSPDQPVSEHVIRGAHDGFVEAIDTNISLIRKRLAIPDLVVRSLQIGAESNTRINYIYIESVADADVVEGVKTRLEHIDISAVISIGQIEDYLEDSKWSPFPQFLNTERPDRVVANLLEGKVAVFTDSEPIALIAPVTFFSFYQSPDDFNGRIYVGSFYRLVRLFSFMMAVFLPAFYIAVIGFHSEILPVDISKQVKLAVNEIPYRPIFEAMLLELLIEIIREASIRLPTPIGQTIGIVGGLVIGDAISKAGLVSNLMVVVVAMTAISSFVVPSVEMNTTIRILRFPFMLAASLFGFFGMVIMTLLLFIHLLNLSSLKQPYLSPIIPFDPSRFKEVFFRVPYTRLKKQQKTFTHGADKEGGGV